MTGLARTGFDVLASGALAIAALISPSRSTAESVRTATSVPIQLGISHDLDSAVLAEHRIVNVVLPASYEQEPGRRYPVLYLIDGGIQQDLVHVTGAVRLGGIWGRSGEAILVGIETKDRRKELTGPTTDPELLKRFPTAGSSAKFRDFIRAEVKPFIERSYRTRGRDLVMGESLAGLFIVETYLAEPTLFDGYAAVDPSLWWDKEALSKAAAAKAGPAQRGRLLLVAAAKEQIEDPAAYKRLIATLRGAKLDACLMPRADQTHATIYQQLTPTVLQYLLPPAEPPSPEYGFVVTCADGV
jgi:predicted alpha/beta superfamily hydrolase